MNDLIEAAILLFYIAVNNKDNNKIMLYKEIIENNKDYNDRIKKEIEDKIKSISDNKINIEGIIEL